MDIDFAKVIPRLDIALRRGLRAGPGWDNRGQMCIEAALCFALGMPHSDQPKCVASSVRSFKIALNDSDWTSSRARAAGLRSLGIAQLGSLGVVDDGEFVGRLREQTVRQIIPALPRAEGARCLSYTPPIAAVTAAGSADFLGAYASFYATIAGAASCAAWPTRNNKYLLVSAGIALQILKDLKSPGCAWIN